MTADTDRLDAMLGSVEAAIRDAQAYEHEQGLTTKQTRKLPADALRSLHRWRTAHTTATTSATLCDKSSATAPRDNGRPTAGDQVHIVCEESPTVPTGPATSVRIPEPLRQQAEAFGREHRWSFGEVTRVALEQLVAGQRENTHDADRQHAQQAARA